MGSPDDTVSTRPVKVGRRRVFVSHASKDRALAQALTELLRLGADVSADDIRCTSVEGLGISVGVRNWNEHLRAELEAAALVVPLLTPSYLDSRMCLLELGAVWAQPDLAVFPVVVKPVTYTDVESVFGQVQGGLIDDKRRLSELRDTVADVLSLSVSRTGMWEEQRDRFLAALTTLSQGIEKTSRVPRSEYETVAQEADALRERVSDLQEALAKAKRDLASADAAPGPAAVATEPGSTTSPAVRRLEREVERLERELDGRQLSFSNAAERIALDRQLERMRGRLRALDPESPWAL
jgi:polyhydroxyalkanoate synthesis regulator phasin